MKTNEESTVEEIDIATALFEEFKRVINIYMWEY